MKKYILIVFAFILFLYCEKPTNNTPQTIISGNIENNSTYCGGAAPPDDLIEQLRIYHPSANQVFYVRQGTTAAPFTNVFDSFSTDVNGNFSISLPIGNYTVITEEKYLLESNPNITDSTCSYLNSFDFNLVVNNNQTIQNKQYTKSCDYNCLGILPQ